MALARMGLHAGHHRVGVPGAVPEPGPLLPRCRGPVDRLAAGPRSPGLLRPDRGLLLRTRPPARAGLSPVGPRHRPPRGGRRAALLALVGAPRAGRGWLDPDHGR